MSVEQAIIKQACHHVVTAKARELFSREMRKGCSPMISPIPVAMEPPYCPISRLSAQTKDEPVDTIPEPIMTPDELRMQIVWLAPGAELSWLMSELLLKHHREVSHRVGFEIVGNKQKIDMRFLVHQNDLPILKAAFRGQFERCEITDSLGKRIVGPPPRILSDLVFNDYFPHPPYSYLLTRPDELQVTTYQSLLAALMEIEPPAIGFYQVLFQPVKPDHNWHRNVQGLLDLEYNIKLMSGGQSPQRFMQQAPSGDLRQMSLELETKAHNDKPFFSTAIRLGVFSARENSDAYIGALSAFMNLFQHGGRSLDYITEKEYSKILGLDSIFNMFLLGITYRPGFLLNSRELTSVVHIPPANILEYRQPVISILEPLHVKNPIIHTGTPIGTCEYAGDNFPVCIPYELRPRSTHIIAKPGQGKSTIMARMILDDIENGMGVAVLDPHNDLLEVLLCLIKEEHIDKVIYFDPGQNDHVPIWNPMKRSANQDLSRTADDLVAAIKSVVTGWGDRLEHLLRHGFYALLQLPNSTLLDLSNLLSRKTDESERLRKASLEIVDNPTAYQFWKYDFLRYSNEALGPPKHKLSKLLVSEKVSRMLSQPDNLIDFRQIMDNGMVLLVNLSSIGSEVRQILGCFMLSLFHLAALSRSDILSKDRKPFNIYADEAHLFLTDALEDLIAETRKFGSNITLAHQFLRQFGSKKVDALSSVGTTIVMNIDAKDAQHLAKDLQNIADYKDIITLKKGEAIARIDMDIVRLKTHGPLHIPQQHHKEEIIQRSLERYYKPSHVIRKYLQSRDKRWDHAFETLTTRKSGNIEEFFYDEF